MAMILVTGGTGLLGSHLLFDLIKQNKQVRATCRRPEKKENVRKVFSYYSEDFDKLFKKIEWIQADLLDFGSVEEAVHGITEVYHAGAVVSFYPEDHQVMRKVNIDGTANLVNLAMDNGIQKFCYVSSVATLGRTENLGESDEDTHWVPSRKNSVYAQTKFNAEREIWRGMAEGLNAVIVNPSVILGPGFWQNNSGLFRLVYEGLNYYTRGVNGYVDVRDVSAAMIELMDQNIFGERFIVSAENLTYQELFSLMAKYLNKPAPSVNVPALLTQIAWRMEAIRNVLTRSKPVVTREMATTAAQIYIYTSAKIRERLKFIFRSAEDSVRDTCKIFLEDLPVKKDYGGIKLR